MDVTDLHYLVCRGLQRPSSTQTETVTPLLAHSNCSCYYKSKVAISTDNTGEYNIFISSKLRKIINYKAS